MQKGLKWRGSISPRRAHFIALHMKRHETTVGSSDGVMCGQLFQVGDVYGNSWASLARAVYNPQRTKPCKSAKQGDAFCFHGVQWLSLLSEERDGNSTLKMKETSRTRESA